jgi:hypothetical protein
MTFRSRVEGSKPETSSMKRLLFAVAAAASLSIAPVMIQGALAQAYAPTPPGPAAAGQDIHAQLDALRDRVKTGFDQGQLSQHETDRLYRELDRIGAIEHSDRTSDGHLREHDRMDLQGRIDNLSRSIHWRRAEGGPPPPSMPMVSPPPAPMPGPVAWTLDQRENWLQGRIDHGIDEHRLSGHEVARGQQELGAIRAQQARLLHQDGGALSAPDHSYLVNRLNELNQTLRWQGRNPPPPWAGL